MSGKDCDISSEEKRVVVFLTTVIRIEEGVTLPQPANDNYTETGGRDDVT